MKFRITTILCTLLLAVTIRAGEQELFDEIVTAIREADSLIEAGKDRQGIAQYQLAQRKLLQFQQAYPTWDTQVVAFRLKYLADQLGVWNDVKSATVASGTVAGESSDARVAHLEQANAQYQVQLRQLHAENSRLNKMLREALAIRPAAQEPAVIAETQSRLEKAEKDLTAATQRIQSLEAELAQYPDPEEAVQNVRLLDETRKNLNQVIAEAEELRSINQTLRSATATATPSNRGGSEELHRGIVAAQAAQQLAENELERLRNENSRLNTRLASLEARFNGIGLAGSNAPTPKLSLVDTARLALADGNTKESLRLLKNAIEQDPRNVEGLYLLGRTFMLEGDPVEAEVSLKKVLELSPDSGVTHFELARLYYSKDTANPGLARWHYHKALNLGFPRHSEFERQIQWEQPGG